MSKLDPHHRSWVNHPSLCRSCLKPLRPFRFKDAFASQCSANITASSCLVRSFTQRFVRSHANADCQICEWRACTWRRFRFRHEMRQISVSPWPGVHTHAWHLRSIKVLEEIKDQSDKHHDIRCMCKLGASSYWNWWAEVPSGSESMKPFVSRVNMQPNFKLLHIDKDILLYSLFHMPPCNLEKR